MLRVQKTRKSLLTGIGCDGKGVFYRTEGRLQSFCINYYCGIWYLPAQHIRRRRVTNETIDHRRIPDTGYRLPGENVKHPAPRWPAMRIQGSHRNLSRE